MYPHRIRLRGPWEYEVLPGAIIAPDASVRGRVTMPCNLLDAGLAAFSGSIRFTRRFGTPRGHDSQEHYWLIFNVRCESMQVVLNEHPLATFTGTGVFAVEATVFLQERNLLEITLNAASDQDGLTGETALEIRRAAYLKNASVRKDATGRLHASVEVAGVVPEGLEVYLLGDRRTLAYLQVRQTGGGVLALESIDVVAPETAEASLELVQGGVVWFRAECQIADMT